MSSAICEWAGDLYRQCRREYDDYIEAAYWQATSDCAAALLSPAGKAAGISSHALFTLPFGCAWRYASDELREWWAYNNRVTFAEFERAWIGGRFD